MQKRIRAIKTEVDEIIFDSKTESKFYVYLKELKKAKRIKGFTLQPKFTLIPKFKNCGKTYNPMTYTLDFAIEHLDSSIEYIDVKGSFISDRTVVKAKLLRSQHENMRVRFLKPYKGNWYDIEDKSIWLQI